MKQPKRASNEESLWNQSNGFLGFFRNVVHCFRRNYAKRFNVGNKLPTLWLWQFRPHRHAAPNNAIGQNPEHSSRRGTLDFDGSQTRRFLSAERGFTMAFGTVLLKQVFPSRNSIRI